MICIVVVGLFFTGACGVLSSAPDDSLEILAVPLDLVAMPWRSQRGGCEIYSYIPPFLSPLTTFRRSWVLSFILLVYYILYLVSPEHHYHVPYLVSSSLSSTSSILSPLACDLAETHARSRYVLYVCLTPQTRGR